jgi:tRNA A-37 threonylcarbamoyl transferase component Bud32
LLPEFVAKEREAGAARKLWRAHYWLVFARVPAAAPIALRLFAGRGHVFARRAGDASLRDELARGALGPAELAAAARSLGDAVGRLHAHGLGNRDLKLDNLVRDPHSGEVRIVDLDGVRRRAAIETRGRGADLGRLLAAFRAAGAPGDARVLRAFLRAYARAHRALLQDPPLRRLLRRAEQRAGEWASAHR